jgi:iron complex transport system permease protein
VTVAPPAAGPAVTAAPRRRGPALAYVVAAVALAAAVLVGLLTGAAGLPPRGVLLELLDRVPGVDVDSGLSPVQEAVLTELRLPRVLTAVLVGGLLAVAGAGYQGVFRNPLADPYLLGAGAGAGLGATLVIAYTSADSVGGVGVVPLAAFAGAIAGVLLSYFVGVGAGRGGASGAAGLVLAGVAVSAFLTAIQTYVQQANEDELRRIFGWMLGRLGDSGWSDLGTALPYAVVSTAALLLHGRLLDVLAVGDEEAAGLGVRAGRVRLVVLLAASLATATAVAISGLIGFVGIVVPHAVRRLVGGSHRVVLPLSLLAGAVFLVLMDVVARTVSAPAELPIGVVTAFVGGPFFLLVLRTTGRADV